MLIISTAEEHGLKQGEHFIRINPRDGHCEIYYVGNEQLIEQQNCQLNVETIFKTLEPLLKRLWDETRGRESQN